MTLPSDTDIGTIRLTVSDLSRSQDYYERALGLRVIERDNGHLVLGAPGGPPLIELTADASAPPLRRHATGLFHLAILLPSRADLAVALRRLSDARVPLDGASDHLVSEALYLHDPDRNGIEIYRDRSREQWPHVGGEVEMASLPLDIEDVLTELPAANSSDAVVATGTRIGHVHLQVADLASAEEFYAGVLGFDVTQRGYRGALFVAAGGYHHHIGLNTWNSLGAGAPPPGSIGLRSFDVALPSATDLEHVLERVHEAGIEAQSSNGATGVRDPSGNLVRLVAR